jgi:ABC-type multidrug transport system permease subunit
VTAIITGSTRPEPPGAWTATLAFGYRALLKIRHVPEQLFDVIAIPVVFTLMFTYLFGGALAGSPGRYLPFLLPGTLVMAVLLVFALCLSWAWTALGLVLRTAQAVMSTGTVVLFPLTLASNVFVQPATMPGWLQAFVRVNPVSHLVTAERGLLSGHPAASQIAWVLLAAAALLAIFAPLTGYLYTRRA